VTPQRIWAGAQTGVQRCPLGISRDHGGDILCAGPSHRFQLGMQGQRAQRTPNPRGAAHAPAWDVQQEEHAPGGSPTYANRKACMLRVAATVNYVLWHTASSYVRCRGRTSERILVDEEGLIHWEIHWCRPTLQINAQGADGRRWQQSYANFPGRRSSSLPCGARRVFRWWNKCCCHPYERFQSEYPNAQVI